MYLWPIVQIRKAIGSAVPKFFKSTPCPYCFHLVPFLFLCAFKCYRSRYKYIGGYSPEYFKNRELHLMGQYMLSFLWETSSSYSNLLWQNRIHPWTYGTFIAIYMHIRTTQMHVNVIITKISLSFIYLLIIILFLSFF